MGGLSALPPPPSSYLFSDPSTIESQVAQGDAIVVQLPSQTPPNNYLAGVVLEDFQVHGNGGGCGIVLAGGDSSSVMRAITINRVLSRQSVDCGLRIQDNVFMVSITNCQFLLNHLDGIRITSASQNGKPSQIWLHDVMSDLNGRDGLRLEENVGDISVFGGTFSDSGQNGLAVYNSSPASIPGATANIFGSHFEGNTSGGISLGGGSGHTIQGNFVASSTGTGISIWTPTVGVAATINGNQLQDTGTDIYIDAVSQNVIIGPQATTTFRVLNNGHNTQRIVTAPF